MNAQSSVQTNRFVVSRNAIVIAIIALLTFLFALFIPAGLISTDTLTFVVVAACFSLAVCGALGGSQARWADPKRAFFSVTLLIWVFLMISEDIFVHLGTASSAAAGAFGAGAYQQVAAWVLSFLVLIFMTIRHPGYVKGLLSGQFKWISLFALVALISVPISVSPSYSLAWVFKMVLVIFLLRALESCLERREDAIRTFQFLLAGILAVAVGRFVAPFLAPGEAFRQGRLELIAGASGYGGLLLVLVLINWKFKKSPWLIAAAIFGVVMMLLAGGKAGILASVLAVIVFFLTIKGARQALAALLVLCFTLAIFIAFTPLGSYLQRYSQSGQASTLSGRLDLWRVIWPEILARPIFGHGYLTSRFLSVEVVGVFPEAGQTHNSFLEPLYNNGILGLVIIVILNVLIVRNLFVAMKNRSDSTIHYLAAGAFAIYVNLFVWGMFTATPFGGQPNSAFMTFLAVFVVSGFLRRWQLSLQPEQITSAQA
jgi:O-Antigen ligase